MKKTRIERKLRRKTDLDLVKTIITSKKNPAWIKISDIISRPRRKKVVLNLDEISSQCKDGDSVLIPGKVLGTGNIDKKIKMIALSFSESAKEKLKKSKIETLHIDEEMKKNPHAKDIKVLVERV
ncbi:MAG: 50S ribosomal protein L18e [Nanoarchaeota archaeon]